MNSLASEILSAQCYCSQRLKDIASIHKDEPVKLFTLAWTSCKTDRYFLLRKVTTHYQCEIILESSCGVNMKKELILKQTYMVLELISKNSTAALNNLQLILSMVDISMISNEQLQTLNIVRLTELCIINEIPPGLPLDKIKEICKVRIPVFREYSCKVLLQFIEDYDTFVFLLEFAIEKIPEVFLAVVSKKLTKQLDYMVKIKNYKLEDYAGKIAYITATKNYKKLLKYIINFLEQHEKDMALLVSLYSKNYGISKFLIKQGANCNEYNFEALNYMKEKGNNELLELAAQYGGEVKNAIDFSIYGKNYDKQKENISDFSY